MKLVRRGGIDLGVALVNLLSPLVDHPHVAQARFELLGEPEPHLSRRGAHRALGWRLGALQDGVRPGQRGPSEENHSDDEDRPEPAHEALPRNPWAQAAPIQPASATIRVPHVRRIARFIRHPLA